MIEFTERALENARHRSHAIAKLGDDELRTVLRAEIEAAHAAGRWVDTVDRYTGASQRVLWLVHEGAGDNTPGWCGAVLRGGQVVACLRIGEARSMIKDMERRRLQATGLVREEQTDAAVLLRYRSLGVPGVAAVEVMRDGTARYVLTEGR